MRVEVYEVSKVLHACKQSENGHAIELVFIFILAMS